jgi:hypothetical protein
MAAALVLGAWHIELVAQAIVVFRNDEPITSWIAVLSGPGAIVK